MIDHPVYGNAPMDEGIVSLVDAMQQAGFHTFCSCEGHEEASASRFPHVRFYEQGRDALRLLDCLLHYRHRLGLYWCLRSGFVDHYKTDEPTLCWTLEVDIGERHKSTKQQADRCRAKDIPVLIEMFEELALCREGGL